MSSHPDQMKPSRAITLVLVFREIRAVDWMLHRSVNSEYHGLPCDTQASYFQPTCYTCFLSCCPFMALLLNSPSISLPLPHSSFSQPKRWSPPQRCQEWNGIETEQRKKETHTYTKGEAREQRFWLPTITVHWVRAGSRVEVTLQLAPWRGGAAGRLSQVQICANVGGDLNGVGVQRYKDLGAQV